MPQTRFWGELTSSDFCARDMVRAIAVLSVAATGQHGPHLSPVTGSLMMEGYLARVVARGR